MSRSRICLVDQRVVPLRYRVAWSAGFRRARRSSSRARPRSAWRWRFRPRATAARPLPISRRYMRTGSSVRPMSSSPRLPRRSPGRRRRRPAVGGLFAVIAVDDVDAHLREHGHGVLDLLGGHLLLRQRRVELVIGDVAALLGLRDQLLDRRADTVEQRSVALVFLAIRNFRFTCCLGRHPQSSPFFFTLKLSVYADIIRLTASVPETGPPREAVLFLELGDLALRPLDFAAVPQEARLAIGCPFRIR